ncbi:peptidase M23 [Actibacterium mucosum KCTC 23349]|uniref:Peptidase M23 n=1 Tax=Actibacterium mucosum KCTC 23349 TaxID=1454373 RepID=A0A037ZI48_9RHOB|nr:peptidase M23 [Actibacterium mucosum KCTC 23349]
MEHRVNMLLGRFIPEQRLFLRSDTETRFIRLSPLTQFVAVSGSVIVVAWALLSAAMILMDSVGAGDLRDQAEREQALYEMRLSEMAEERDNRAEEASSAQNRYALALDEVSKMQSALLNAEDRVKELETGISVIQRTLQRTVAERDAARTETEGLRGQLQAEADGDVTDLSRMQDMEVLLQAMVDTLGQTAAERDLIAADAAAAYGLVKEMDYQRALDQDRTDRIFSQLEDALAVSVQPLDDMFRKVGIDSQQLIGKVREGYSGQGGPSLPIVISTKGDGEALDPNIMRAKELVEQLDRLNLYRIAAEKTPFDMPLRSAYRFTSGFGPRWGRMHNGADFAGAHGSPVYSTADGVVLKADWASGYGRLITIQHEFGIETRYAHLAKIRVKVGQRVSRGERIGDMGNSGRSTGTHLHYEVRVGGKPVNPMTYIKAARDVF